MIDELEAIERGEHDRLMVHMPPRYGKTLLCSILFPAWYLGRHPERKVILASYGAELAHDNGRQCRNLVMSEAYQDCFATRVTDDSAAAHRWHTQQGGGLIATGIPGPITGRGANCLIIDDPLRGRADAESQTVRASVWAWWQSDARTRLELPATVLMPCTRWHEDDLPGRLLAQDDEAWRVVSLPAISEGGVALWPERYPLEWLERTRAEIGAREWTALYQQRPSPVEGAIFKWFPRYPGSSDNGNLPPLSMILLPIDTAVTATGDYWAWSAWGIRGKNIDLLEAWRVKADPPIAEEHIFRTYADLVSRYKIRVAPLVRESVAIDRVAASHLQHRRIPVTAVKMPSMGGKGVKEGLANIIVDFFQSGLARVPEYASWLEPWLEEHKGFPNVPDDHWVENTILALYAFREMVRDDKTKVIHYRRQEMAV